MSSAPSKPLPAAALPSPPSSPASSSSPPPPLPLPLPLPPDPDPAHLFQDAEQTAAYARHRPHYPQQLYDMLYEHALPGRAPPFPDLTVVDVATGSGQALGPMPRDFGTCIALDVSAAQLLEVPGELRRCVRVAHGDAHDTGLPPGSVDLVTVGQALHWFRLDDFYTECRRLLKPSGALAAWTYDFGKLYGFPGSQEMYEQLYGDTLGGYWAKGREWVDAYYVGIEPGPQHFGRVERLQLPLPTSVTLDELVGQVRSWSGYRSFVRAHPAAPDPAEQFRRAAAARMAEGAAEGEVEGEAEGVAGGAEGAAEGPAGPGAAARATEGPCGGLRRLTEGPCGGLRRLTLQRTLTLLIALRPVARTL